MKIRTMRLRERVIVTVAPMSEYMCTCVSPHSTISSQTNHKLHPGNHRSSWCRISLREGQKPKSSQDPSNALPMYCIYVKIFYCGSINISTRRLLELLTFYHANIHAGWQIHHMVGESCSDSWIGMMQVLTLTLIVTNNEWQSMKVDADWFNSISPVNAQ